MDQKIQQQLLDKSSQFINQAARILGQTSGHVYSVLVRQQVIDGIANILSLILFFAIVIIPSMLVMKKAWAWHKEDEQSEAAMVMLIIGPILFIIVGLIIATTLQSSLEQIFNPEYFAIKFIFDSITNHN